MNQFLLTVSSGTGQLCFEVWNPSFIHLRWTWGEVPRCQNGIWLSSHCWEVLLTALWTLTALPPWHPCSLCRLAQGIQTQPHFLGVSSDELAFSDGFLKEVSEPGPFPHCHKLLQPSQLIELKWIKVNWTILLWFYCSLVPLSLKENNFQMMNYTTKSWQKCKLSCIIVLSHGNL